MSEHPLAEDLRYYAAVTEKEIVAAGAHWCNPERLREAAAELDRLAAANAKVEAVQGLPGEWLADLGPVPLLPDELERLKCAEQVVTALASSGPSLRETVEGAVAALRRLASVAGSSRSIAFGNAADLVQAALDGE